MVRSALLFFLKLDNTHGHMRNTHTIHPNTHTHIHSCSCVANDQRLQLLRKIFAVCGLYAVVIVFIASFSEFVAHVCDCQSNVLLEHTRVRCKTDKLQCAFIFKLKSETATSKARHNCSSVEGHEQDRFSTVGNCDCAA